MRCPVCRTTNVTEQKQESKLCSYVCNKCWVDSLQKQHTVFWHDLGDDEVFWPVTLTAKRNADDNENVAYVEYTVT